MRQWHFLHERKVQNSDKILPQQIRFLYDKDLKDIKEKCLGKITGKFVVSSNLR